MAIFVEGKLTGRTKRLTEDGRTIVTLRIKDDEGTQDITWFEPDIKEVPKVNDKVKLPVFINVYTRKNGQSAYQINVVDTSLTGEEF